MYPTISEDIYDSWVKPNSKGQVIIVDNVLQEKWHKVDNQKV